MNVVPTDWVEQLRLLRQQVDYLLEQDVRRETQAVSLRPVDFTALDEPQLAHELALLAAWVHRLIDRYDLGETIPGCWRQHGPITEELAALRTAWHGAYTDPAARPFDAAHFHDTLERTLARIRDWDRTGCARGTHREQGPPVTALTRACGASPHDDRHPFGAKL